MASFRTAYAKQKCLGGSTNSTLQTRELEQQEAELAEGMNGTHIGRGKGAYASKVILRPTILAFSDCNLLLLHTLLLMRNTSGHTCKYNRKFTNTGANASAGHCNEGPQIVIVPVIADFQQHTASHPAGCRLILLNLLSIL